MRGTPTHLLISLGSGGHTAEMLSYLTNLDSTLYTHRTYVISSGDEFSAQRAIEFERTLDIKTSTYKLNTTASLPRSQSKKSKHPSYSLCFVPRAREIHQSLLTTPLSSLHCLKACISLLCFPTPPTPPTYPDLILVNGPATSVILIIASLLLRFFSLPGTKGKMRSIYIESWARVNKLSLSGRILVGMGAVDRIMVQWEELAGRGLGEYRGWLVH